MLKLILLTVTLTICITFSNGLMGVSRKGAILHRPPPLPQPVSRRAVVETKWIKQKVDNFDAQNTDKWDMRYMENNEFFKPGGPIFIFVGGEWTISSGQLLGGHIYDMAKKHNGIYFYTEHRFYGRSLPTPDASTENLKHLNVDQALADLAHFIVETKKTTPGLENSRVILVGGSYSATMVVWFRQKYPHLVDGSWASSAPLFAKADFVEYKEVVGDSIKLVGGEKCYNRIENAIKELEKLAEDKNYDKITELFYVCDPLSFDDKLNKWMFFDSLTEVFSGLVQYHYPGLIDRACEKIMSGPNDLKGLADFINEETGCVETNYKAFVKYYSEDKWGTTSTAAGRQWLYQTCGEYGWYQSSGSNKQPFGSNFPYDLYIQMCSDLYTTKFTPAIVEENLQRTNVIYGGMNPGVTNVLFTHGQLDPWRPMGIQKDYNEQSPAVVIPLASHVTDLGSITSSDSKEMREVKELISKLVDVWLNQSKTC